MDIYSLGADASIVYPFSCKLIHKVLAGCKMAYSCGHGNTTGITMQQ